MRSSVLVFTCLLLLACSGSADDDPVDRDAGTATDAGRDAGGISVACGSMTCAHPAEYCRATPTGPCEARDGGACGPTEEACRDESITGCTSAQTYECPALPSGCTSCPCVIFEAPCGQQVVNAVCNGSPTAGVRVQCPFP